MNICDKCVKIGEFSTEVELKGPSGTVVGKVTVSTPIWTCAEDVSIDPVQKEKKTPELIGGAIKEYYELGGSSLLGAPVIRNNWVDRSS